MYSSARTTEALRSGLSMVSGSGVAPSMVTTISGLVPQVTIGGRSPASSVTVLSKAAPGSVRSVFQ